jgi:hypothetical protein
MTERDGAYAMGRIDRSGGVIRGGPAEREREIPRPNSAPAYYQGRPACFWITATSPRRKRNQDRSVRKMGAGAMSDSGPDRPAAEEAA